jgi:hypothetical protein
MTVVGKRDVGLSVRAESLGLVERMCRRMVDVVRVGDHSPLLAANAAWTPTMNTVLVKKYLTLTEFRRGGPDQCRLQRPKGGGEMGEK